MKLLDEIREQPLHIRKLFMWTSVVITFSLVGFVWLNNTKNNVVALLQTKPSGAPDERALAQTTEEPSPFAAIGKAFSNLRANIGELVGKKAVPTPEPTKTIPPQLLP